MKKFLLSVVTVLFLFAGNVSAACCNYCDCGCDGYCNELTEQAAPTDKGYNKNFAVEVLNLVNEQRAKVGAPPLRLAEDLQQATAIRAREIVQVFSHTRPDGSDCFTVMKKRGRTCGENIAAGNSSASATVEQWMNSQGHRENILNPNFRELGVGYAYEDYSTYHHYWVQLFRG